MASLLQAIEIHNMRLKYLYPISELSAISDNYTIYTINPRQIIHRSLQNKNNKREIICNILVPLNQNSEL